MTTRIQLRRDTAQNWSLNNPILLSGELGIETDTLKIKIGNGSRWNSILNYAFKVGQANGVATLDSTGKIPSSQIPTNINISELIDSLTTSDIEEGSNLYFTNSRAISANASAITNAIATEVTNRNTAISTAKNEAIAAASTDATTKANLAQSTAASDATVKANAAKNEAIAASAIDATTKVNSALSTVASNLNSAISAEASNRNSAISTAISGRINTLTTSSIAEGTNKYFTDARAKAAVASDIADAIDAIQYDAGITDLASFTTSNLAEGSNLYFTNARAISATNNKFNDILIAINTATDDLSLTISNDYLSKSEAASTYVTSQTLSNTVSDYVLESDRNQQGGFAGLDNTTHIVDSVIPTTIARVSSPTFTGTVNASNLTITGNLTVSGTTTTVNSENLSINDPLIKLSQNQYTADVVDIGIYGSYGASGNNAGNHPHTGLVRDASDKKWKLISGAAEPISNEINFASVVYDTLKVGGLEVGSVTNTEIGYLSGVTSSIQSQISSKAPVASPTFTGTVSGITKSMVGLGNVDNTTDANKPISSATQAALNAKLTSAQADLKYATIENPSFIGVVDFSSVTVTGLTLGDSLPSQSGNYGKYLTTDGSTASWSTINLSSYLSKTEASSDYLKKSDAANAYQSKITYGTTQTPTTAGVAGDIYIQY
jgi:hypothetical protein